MMSAFASPNVPFGSDYSGFICWRISDYTSNLWLVKAAFSVIISFLNLLRMSWIWALKEVNWMSSYLSFTASAILFLVAI